MEKVYSDQKEDTGFSLINVVRHNHLDLNIIHCGELYLAPGFHLPSVGTHLHQTGNCSGRFDSSVAVFVWYYTLWAVNELDTGHSPLSYAQITGCWAGWHPQHLPSGSGAVDILFLSFKRFLFIIQFLIHETLSFPFLDKQNRLETCTGCIPASRPCTGWAAENGWMNKTVLFHVLKHEKRNKRKWSRRGKCDMCLPCFKYTGF